MASRQTVQYEPQSQADEEEERYTRYEQQNYQQHEHQFYHNPTGPSSTSLHGSILPLTSHIGPVGAVELGEYRYDSGPQNLDPGSTYYSRAGTQYNDAGSHAYAVVGANVLADQATAPKSRDEAIEKYTPTPGSPSGLSKISPPFSRKPLQISRAILNTLGPIAVVGAYVFIVVMYLMRPSVNNIIPWYPVDAKIIFYAWVILGIFILEWAKAGLAGFEAAILMRKGDLKAHSAQMLVEWHSDRAWGTLSGWWKALIVTWRYIRARIATKRGFHVRWDGPSAFWFYLALSSILFYAAVPLSALTLDPNDALQLSTRPIIVTGTNQSTFDTRSSNGLAQQADERWRQGNPTRPNGATIFYAPETFDNPSESFYEDTIRGIYQAQLDAPGDAINTTVTFFSGPEVSERAHGSAWGLETGVSCMPVHPYNELKLVKITSINNWTNGRGSNSALYGTDSASIAAQQSNLDSIFFNNGDAFGVLYQYLVATDGFIEGATSEYAGALSFPLNGSLEVVIWQTYNLERNFFPDKTFEDMPAHPKVATSFSPITNQTYLGYGVRCYMSSSTGTAKISAAHRTYSNFAPIRPDEAQMPRTNLTITQYPGVASLHTLAFLALTSVNIGHIGPVRCRSTPDGHCDGWIGANKATNGNPVFSRRPEVDNTVFPGFKVNGNVTQYPTISPERMTLAIYKLIGEVSVAMMSAGQGNWTSVPDTDSTLGLFGLDHANEIVPGVVPYMAVIVLFGVWMVVTVVPQLWPAWLLSRRDAAVIDGLTMFQLGTQYSAGDRG